MTRDSNDPIPKDRFQAPRHVCDLGMPSTAALGTLRQEGGIGALTNFAYEYFKTTPDIVILGKSMGGGLPLGLVALKNKIKNSFPGAQSSTFQGNILSIHNSYFFLKELKKINYLKKIGWKSNEPCFYRIDLNNDIPKKYLNISAKKLHDKKQLKFFRQYIQNSSIISNNYDDLEVAIITPDKDIIPDAETLNPAYVVFNNYEIILQWNRSLRFALAVCTLKDKFKNEL